MAEHTQAAFRFVRESQGSARLTIGGDTIDALLVSEPTRQGFRVAGRISRVESREVAVLQTQLANEPRPGEVASLDGWDCQVADEGVTYVPGGYIIQLQTRDA